jgi:hypothetical protein
VSAEDKVTGVKHTFKAGDVLRIKVYGKKDAESVYLQKDFPVVENTSEVEIYLTEEDTRIGEVISKPVDYWYEVELNPDEAPQTIIGYNDEDGAVIFKLFPEGADVENYEPDPEDFPVVDEELDMSSPRPVSNRVIARAFMNLEAGYEAVHDAVSKLHVTPQMFGAVGDGVAEDTEAFQAAIDSGKPIFVPGGTYIISSVDVNDSVVLEGNGCTIKSTGDGFVLNNALAKKVFKGIKFSCNNGSAITVNTVADTNATNTLIVEKCSFEAEEDSNHYAIKLFGENEANIVNSAFYGCNGISVDGSVNPNVANCTFRHSKVAIMYVHSGKVHENAAYTCGLRVSGTTVLGCEIGIKAVDTDSLQVNNCMIDYCDNPLILVGQAGAFLANSYISSRYDNPAIYACRNNANTGKYGGNGLNTVVTEKLCVTNCTILTHVEDKDSSKVSAIVLNGCAHCVISNSHITWFTQDGVQITDCEHTSLSELHIACDSRMADRSGVYAINSYVGDKQEDNGSSHYSAINTELPIFYHYAKIRNVSNANGFNDEARNSIVVSSGVSSHTVTIGNSGTLVGVVATLSRTDYRVGVNTDGNKVTFTFDRTLEHNIRINYIAYFTR